MKMKKIMKLLVILSIGKIIVLYIFNLYFVIDNESGV